MVTDQRTGPTRPTRPTRPAAVELHVVLERLVAAADSGDALEAFLHAAGAAQIVADRLQGASLRSARPSLRLLPPQGAVGVLKRAAETAATAVRGRLGLAEWHVLLRDLANVLAEAVLGDTAEDAAGVLLSVRTTVEELRSGVPPHTARLLSGALLHEPSSFREVDLRPEDVVELTRRFAECYPDRERPLLVLGLRSSGGYLAPLAASALGRLEYAHVVARTTRPGGPLLPEEPRLPESLRRVGGLVLLLGAPPRSGASLASVAARFAEAGFSPERIVPVYASLDDKEQQPRLLHRYPTVVLPAPQWRISRLLGQEHLASAVAELLPAGSTLVSVNGLTESAAPTLRTHRSVEFNALVEGADGERRTMRLAARGLPLGLEPPTAPDQLGVVDRILITRSVEERILAEGGS